MGHVVRMRLLARLLAERGLSVCFASKPNTPGWDYLAAAGMPLTDTLPTRGNIGICDIEHGPSENMLGNLKTTFRRVVTVYGGHSFPLAAPDAVECLSDLVVCQSLFEFDRPAHVLQGTKYLLLDPAYAECRPNVAGPVVVCMGGADPHCLSGRVAHALVGLGRTVKVVVGQAAQDPFTEMRPLNALPVYAPTTLVPHLAGASLFVGALGMVAYEALAAGVPVILYAWSDNHKATADELQRRGVGRSLGLWNDFDPVKLRNCVETWLAESKLLPRYQRRARELVDGGGAARVAARIRELLR